MLILPCPTPGNRVAQRLDHYDGLTSAIGADVEDAVVALRKELSELGVDHGPATIQWHLGRRGLKSVPSQATIWRVLARRGFVVPEPRKRPKSSFRRGFEATAPNELWQTDAIDA